MNKRAAPRIIAELRAVLVCAHDVPTRVEGVTVDIGRGGCRLRLTGPVALDAAGTLTVFCGAQRYSRPVQSMRRDDDGTFAVTFAAAAKPDDSWSELLASAS